MASLKRFEEEYSRLNSRQREAVDIIEGPVMVIAGPGTGKTQILALRIVNILRQPDHNADEVLCLTFTNSGVRAMKSRLMEYIGEEAAKVNIFTFHGFGLELIQKYYENLGFRKMPELLSDAEGIFLVDDLLQNKEWKHLRPRANPEMYFSDLKHLISLLKRERLSSEKMLASLEEDISALKSAPESISSRGESKGQLKKEVLTKIDSLERTKEVMEFYKLYEEKKLELGFIDYDDILEYAVRLAEGFEDVRADIYEAYQYVLVDEHQDSSQVQNNFLKAVWKNTELPNIFVVGDDRQLIYGFSGASLSYFEEFSHVFGKAKLITLVENYRSTSNILSLADDLLQSSLSKEKLKSNTPGEEKIFLREYSYPRDEILGAGLYFKEKISSGLRPEDCLLLVPKNYQVRNAIDILSSMGLPVATGKNLSLFQIASAQSLLRVLRIMANPFDSVSVSASLLDKYSGIPAMTAHKFLKSARLEKLSVEDIMLVGQEEGLFAEEDPVRKWGRQVNEWISLLSSERLSFAVSFVGQQMLVKRAKSHEELIRNVEVVRSFIHLATMFEEKKTNKGLGDFVAYLARLENYGNHIGVAVFGEETGVQVMTLHKSKGLEYQSVWIAHMNEEVLMSEKRNSFALPEKVKEAMSARDLESSKRELFVAITRAKKFCNISYASENYSGGEMELAQILKELPQVHFIRQSKTETETEIISHSPEAYTPAHIVEAPPIRESIRSFVEAHYSGSRISVSLLNNFFECPWKWYFRNFLRLPEIKSASLAFGSAVHGTIEFILKYGSVPPQSSIVEKLEEVLRREGVSEAKEIHKLAREGERAVSVWIKNFYGNLADKYESERSVQFKDPQFPELMMYGKIDLTERTQDGEMIITDFKTGSVKTKSSIEKIDDEGRLSPLMRQLAMYSYLVRGAEKGKEVFLSRLLFLEAKEGDKNALYSTHVSEEQLDLLKRDIQDYQNLLKSGEWMARPCRYNSYGRNIECEYCKMAEVSKN